MHEFLSWFGSWESNTGMQWFVGFLALIAGIMYFRLFFAHIGPLATERAGFGILRTFAAIVCGFGFAFVSFSAIGMLTP